MTVTYEQAMNGLANFAELDTIPIMPNSLKKVGVVMAVESLKKNPSFISKPYESYFKMLGVLSEDGKTVNVDMLSDYLKSAMQKVPNVTLWGFTFDASDVDKLISRLGGA